MKKIFTKLMLLAVAATAIVSCDNNFEEQTPNVELTQTVTLAADKTAVRTELIDGVPYWSKDDAVGVYLEDETKDYKFTNDSEEATLTTSFTGTTAVANTLFVYYPYTSNGVGVNGAKVEMPANQNPTVASFDGAADIMIAKPVTLDAEGTQVENLEFARVGAIVKIVLRGEIASLAGQHISSLTMTAESNLVGRVYLDVKNQQLGELYYNQSKSVTATYTEATQFEVNGTNAVYVVVYPQTLAAGTTLSFEASTEGYAISKSIELGQDIVLLPGKVTTLGVTLAAEHIVSEETGLALPFEDDFARIAQDTNEAGITVAALGENYSEAVRLYKAKVEGGVIKLGSGDYRGSFTTVDLDLSQPFTVVVDAMAWIGTNGSADTSTLYVTVGETTMTSENLGSAFASYKFEFPAAGKKEKVKVGVSGKRGYINDLKVVAGHDYVLPPVLTVNVESITNISHEGENVTFVYSVANPVEGTSVVITDDADWITTADNNGTVTVTVAENTLEEERNATITVKYGDLTKTIAIQQNAKPAAGGEPTAQYVKVTTAQSDWSGTYLIVSGTSAATTMNGSWLKYQTVTVSNDIIASNTNTDAIAVTIDKVGEKYTIKLSDGKYLKTSNSNDGITSVATADNNSYWTFTIESSAAKIVWGGNASRHLRLNGTSGFRTYTSTTGTIATLYKLVGGSSEGGDTPSTPAPELAITTTSPIAVGAEGDVATVAYTITNPVEGKSVTASADQTWVNGFDYTVAGEVSFAVEANTGAAREATVTLSYDGAESKTIKVSQAAGNTGGGDVAVKGYKKVTTITSGKKYLIVGGGLAKVLTPTTGSGRKDSADVTIADDFIASDATIDSYAVTITANGSNYDISFVSGSSTYYLIYGSSTNLNTATSATKHWQVSAASKAGTFAFVDSSTTSRGLIFRASTYNQFGGYSSGNPNGTEYYNIDLYEYQD